MLSHPSSASRGLRRRLLVAGLAAAIAAAGVGCSGAPDGTAPEAVGSSTQAITGTTVLSRADQWVKAKLLYCQSANGAPDLDPACSSVCTRESNPLWDPYRSDCSGFVSWAWNLPAPGNTTSEFAPADTSVSYVINGSDLQPGDALNIPGDHMVLFVGWITPGSDATFYEEPGCSSSEPYAHSFTSSVTISGSNVDIAYEGKTFTAIRYTGLTGVGEGGVDAAPPPVPCTETSSGAMGDCLDTSVCASMGGTSSPGYCPGPANIQCCTGVPDAGMTPPPDAGTTPDPDAGGTGPGTGSTPDGGGGMKPLPHDGGTSGSSGDGSVDDMPPWNRKGSGCSVASARGGRGEGGGWYLLGLGALGLASLRRKRRA